MKEPLRWLLGAVRLAGRCAGIWLMLGVLTHWMDLLSWPPGTAVEPAWTETYLTMATGPGAAVILGLLLALSWERIPSPGVWIFLVSCLVLSAVSFTLFMLAPFLPAWRPHLLLREGLLQPVLAWALFFAVQIVAIVLQRIGSSRGSTDRDTATL